jgi:hypothetical protein
MKKTLAALAAALLAAAPSAAQPFSSAPGRDGRLMAGVGYGAVFSGPTSGPGWSGQAHYAFARSPGTTPVRVRAEAWALAQRGTAEGSPLACTRVPQLHCFGRADHSTLAGAGVSVAAERAHLVGRVRSYVRSGAGVYHRRLRSVESEGPAGICFGERELVPCPDARPFRDDVLTRGGVAPGAHVGFGVRVHLAGVAAFADVSVHYTPVHDGPAGAAPLTLGFSL